MAMEVNATKEGYIIEKYNKTFEDIWNDTASIDLTLDFIESYEEVFKMKRTLEDTYLKYQLEENKIRPNYMQRMALIELEATRLESDRGLIIAATGTGKIYLSAFDVENANAKKVLFLVHNRLILSDAINTYERVFRDKKILELNSSNLDKLNTTDFIFTTDKTAYTHLLNKVDKNYFDYIIYDEAHKIGEDTQYQVLINYFKPKFMLGMTATPERTDNKKFLFETFDYNVPYEIRLLDAMNSELVSPFNYYGYDLDEKLLDVNEKFNYEELVKYLKTLIEEIGHYGSKLKGLVFASSIEEANTLSKYFNENGIVSKSAVSTNSNNEETSKYIKSLRSDDKGSVELIVTVNKFNEGVDIPELNLIIMLRNTTSSIIYLQQLGRGLRVTNDPDKFLTVIDIIGNSKNSYTIAEVLTGNETKDKRALLRHVDESFNLVSPFINVTIEEKAIENIIRSISNDFKVGTQLKRKFNDELGRYYQIPRLLEMYLSPNFKELELLQLLFKNFHTPLSKHYFEKYKIKEDDLFIKNFFILITQFVFRAYNSDLLEDYVRLLKGEKVLNQKLMNVLLPKEFDTGITTAINSNYHKESNNFPKVFEILNEEIKLTKEIIMELKSNNAYELFLEHIELFEYLSLKDSYEMQTFDLVDKAEFLFNVDAKDCYMNVVGEKIDDITKKVYCTIKITTKESHYDNYIIDNDKIVYYTQNSVSRVKALEKIEKLISENYEFKICASFPHLGYSNTSYFNLGDLEVYEVSDVIENSNKKFNHKIIFKLKNIIPSELLMYK